MTEPTPKRRRRTNAEILADNIAKKKAKTEAAKATPRSTRKTTPKKAATKPSIKAESEPSPYEGKIIRILKDDYWLFGTAYNKGDIIPIKSNKREYHLSFDRNGTFIFNKTPERQRELWGEVRYEVLDESDGTNIG